MFRVLGMYNFGWHYKNTLVKGGALCVQMDFTWTFQTNTKCNNINSFWSHFYQILVVLKYHRRLWANIFDTDISRCIYIIIKVVYLALFGIFILLTSTILQKLLQKWFILLHLVLLWNVHVKSIWTHNGGIWGSKSDIIR